MLNPGDLMVTIGATTAVVFVVEAVHVELNRRRARRAGSGVSKESAAVARSVIDGDLDKAIMIQQRHIQLLDERSDRQDLEIRTLRAENDELRAQNSQMHDRLRRKDEEIAGLYASVGRLEATRWPEARPPVS